MKNKTIKIILSVIVLSVFFFFSPNVNALTSVYVSPANLTKNVGENIDLTVGVTESESKVYAVEGKIVFNNLTCRSITVAEGITSQTTPTCSNPYFLLGIQSGITTNKNLFTVVATAEKEGQASVTFTDIDIVGEGVSLSKASNTGNFMINGSIVVPVVETKSDDGSALKKANVTKNTKSSTQELRPSEPTQRVSVSESNAVDQTASVISGTSQFSWKMLLIGLGFIILIGFGIYCRHRASEMKK